MDLKRKVRRRRIACPNCSGTGGFVTVSNHVEKKWKCHVCNGKGKVWL